MHCSGWGSSGPYSLGLVEKGTPERLEVWFSVVASLKDWLESSPCNVEMLFENLGACALVLFDSPPEKRGKGSKRGATR